MNTLVVFRDLGSRLGVLSLERICAPVSLVLRSRIRLVVSQTIQALEWGGRPSSRCHSWLCRRGSLGSVYKQIVFRLGLHLQNSSNPKDLDRLIACSLPVCLAW